ncbi:MAG TPA: PLP-dependent aspartate aminotransferase family protein [Longimicrobiales bacterium]|nr:PLP-dependent aspartate aminotransferase family protein [Longimicrobiales bacterium]
MKLGTLAIHAGQHPEETTGAIMPPIFQTSTYVQPKLGEPKQGYEYARVQNPTREALERNIAALESGAHGMAFASGMAAIGAILQRLSTGDHVIYEENVYGGTHRFFDMVMRRLGIDFTAVDSSDAQRVEDAIRPNTKLIHLETPTNPMMKLCDLRAIADIAQRRHVQVAVDNTFASPYNQRPLELGAHIVVHSSTKYLNGHSDVIGGIVVTNDDTIAGELRFLQKAAGAVPGPWDAWLVLRGVKTLHVRMRAHNLNGQRVAGFLVERLGAEHVHYPGLPTHPQHALAQRQMSGFTGMISIELGSLERATRVVERTRIFSLAESLGGVESLIGHPAIMTHAAVPKEMRDRMGVTDGLVRLSVGIEDIDDLLEDLEQAMAGL